jgi:hypothetical protein
MIWDAPQCSDWDNGNAYEQATEVDGNALVATSRLFLNTPNPAFSYNRPIYPGLISGPALSASIATLDEKKENLDFGPGQGYFNSTIRFRHLNNTTLNALCVDGHVESRAAGTIMELDICMQPLQD